MSTETETEEIYEPREQGMSTFGKSAAVARRWLSPDTALIHWVGFDNSTNDRNLDAWVIWTEFENGEHDDHYDALRGPDGEVVEDPDLDLDDAADIAHLQLKRDGAL